MKLHIDDLKGNQKITISDYEYKILRDIKEMEGRKELSYIFVNPVNLKELNDVFTNILNSPGTFLGKYLEKSIFLNEVKICNPNSPNILSFFTFFSCVFESIITFGNIDNLKDKCEFLDCTFNTQ
ncbi:hypothetical protein LGK95_19825 [Clostridium algoriphilum]|uniref:hypothetical protein n=1 Tax=Clostridium algoriphilum TaxID=198347 RepID=UPI001CF54072|nr:hypothetical protein [Clostridium algoriphilum]MCB2295727.1 hypothetical protein [Clostridium algoriphilum]